MAKNIKYSLYEVNQVDNAYNYKFITFLYCNGKDPFTDIYELLNNTNIKGVTSINIMNDESWVITKNKTYRIDIDSVSTISNYGT